MSKNLSAVASTEFDSEVKQAYQGGSKLRDTVTHRGNVTGGTYTFRAVGKGLANQKPSQGLVTPMDISHSEQACVLQDWIAPEYTDIFDDAEVNFSEQQELAEAIASALGRREDQLIIDAASAASAGGAVAAGGTGLTAAKVITSSKHFNDAGVPTEDRTAPISAAGLEDLLNEDKATSFDYQQVRALIDGQINTGFGFTWKVIESRDEGGIPKSGATRTSTFYHKRAIGLATGIGPRTEVNYVAERTSWLANGLLKANAVARDTAGLVDVAYDE
tara:strand:- start:1481 stop:2305 length:825 start_codon:yes stop_codon:yes gene_type:complete